VEKRLKELEKASNTADLLNSFKNLGNDLMDLAKLSGKRQAVSEQNLLFFCNKIIINGFQPIKNTSRVTKR